MLNYEDLLAAYEWVSADPTYENSAFVNRTTGSVYWDSDAIEAEEELPEDIEDGTKYIAVPHKHDLDLGKSLVFEFVDEYFPDDTDKISAFFRKSGAFGRFKDLLEQKHLLETWYEYERNRVKVALLQWAEDNSIPHQSLSGKNAA